MSIRIDGTNTTANPGITGSDTDTGLQFGTNEVSIVTDGTARATVDSSGQVGVGLTSPSSLLHLKSTSFPQLTVERDGSGTQGAGINLLDGSGDENRIFTTDSSIVFDTGASSTELARIQSGGGISFNGDTAAANALDDYEEGTWTPELKSTSTNPSVTYGARTGYYTKIGRIVYFHASMQWSARASQGTGSILLKTPFDIANVSWQGTFMTPYVNGLSTTAVGTSYADQGQGGFFVRNASTTNTNLGTGVIMTSGHIIYGGFFIPA